MLISPEGKVVAPYQGKQPVETLIQDASVRDGQLAVKWATQAAKLTNNKDPGYLDTLGAAYAEVGDFDQALKIANHALLLAQQQNRKELIPGLQKAMAVYSKRQPMR